MKEEKKDLVSIITPTYNSSKYIVETIESILNQTYSNWELLITDDCSIDDTLKIIDAYVLKDKRIKLFQLNENSGAGIARNYSIEKSSGRYIAFCDSDDQWLPNKLAKQVSMMKENGIALSFSSYHIIDEEGHPKGKVIAKSKVDYKVMLRNNYIGCLTAMYDAIQLGKVYMPEIRKRQDWALWLSILKLTDKAYGIKEPLAVYRDRSNSISTNKKDLIKYNWAIYRDVEGFSFLKSCVLLIQFVFFYLAKKI